MKTHIPIPDGLKLPKDAETKPFTAEVEFLAMDGMLMPVSVAGMPLASEEPEMEEEEYEEGAEMEEGAEGEAEMEEGEEGGEMCEKCGGDKAKCGCGKMRGGAEPEGGGFMIAIERALAQPKR
jgi:hypothetical protein